ncbi:MAG: hypothetical protein AAGA25_08625 [Planctomycetota bacterium]
MSDSDSTSKTKVLTGSGLAAAAVCVLGAMLTRGIKQGAFDGLFPSNDEPEARDVASAQESAESSGVIKVDASDYLDALLEASKNGPAVSPDDPVTQENAAKHIAAAALRASEKTKANQASSINPSESPRVPSERAKQAMIKPSKPVHTSHVQEQPQKQIVVTHGAGVSPFGSRPRKPKTHDELMEENRERVAAIRQPQGQPVKPQTTQGQRRVVVRADASSAYPPAIGPCRPETEKAILSRLDRAIQEFEATSAGHPLFNVDDLMRKQLIEASDVVSPASGYPLTDEYDRKNNVEKGWWVRRFSSVVLLREPPRVRMGLDDPKWIQAFTRTFLNAPGDEQQGAVLWSDRTITFETDWSRIDEALRKQTRKSTAELIADPLPNFPR